RAIQRVPLRRLQLLEVLVDALARLRAVLGVAQILGNFVSRENGLRNIVKHQEAWNIARRVRLQPDLSTASQIASANCCVVAVPPRSRVRACPAESTASSACIMRSAADP